jgi:hypothetical protein
MRSTVPQKYTNLSLPVVASAALNRRLVIIWNAKIVMILTLRSGIAKFFARIATFTEGNLGPIVLQQCTSLTFWQQVAYQA